MNNSSFVYNLRLKQLEIEAGTCICFQSIQMIKMLKHLCGNVPPANHIMCGTSTKFTGILARAHASGIPVYGTSVPCDKTLETGTYLHPLLFDSPDGDGFLTVHLRNCRRPRKLASLYSSELNDS